MFIFKHVLQIPMLLFAPFFLTTFAIAYSTFKPASDMSNISVTMNYITQSSSFSPNHFRSRLVTPNVLALHHRDDRSPDMTHALASFDFDCLAQGQNECMARVVRAAYAISNSVGVDMSLVDAVIAQQDWVIAEKILADPLVSQAIKSHHQSIISAHPVAKGKPVVILMGDSTIDNKLWCGGEQNDVPHQLQKLFGEEYEVKNLAVDGYTTSSIADNTGAGSTYALTEALVKLHHVSHLVLSVGGNDIRDALHSGDRAQLKNTVIKLQENYQRILQTLKSIAPGAAIILMTQYRVDRDDSKASYRIYGALANILPQFDPMISMHAMMQIVYGPIIATARAEGFTIADLANSLNPYDTKFFSSQIEPSKDGGETIAFLLDTVIRDTTGSFGESHIYNVSGPDEAMSIDSHKNNHDSENPWCVKMPLTNADGMPIDIVPGKNDDAALDAALKAVNKLLE